MAGKGGVVNKNEKKGKNLGGEEKNHQLFEVKRQNLYSSCKKGVEKGTKGKEGLKGDTDF